MGKKVYALFGGSFDPPHLAHQEIVKKVLAGKLVDGVILVPTFLNPFKKSFALPPKKRYLLLKKIFRNKAVYISQIESKKKHPSYTIDTLRRLRKQFNIKYLIIGADNLKSIQKWKNFKRLNSTITWIVAKRPKEKLNCNILQRCIVLNLHIDVSSSEIRAGKKLQFLDKKIKQKVIDGYKLKSAH